MCILKKPSFMILVARIAVRRLASGMPLFVWSIAAAAAEAAPYELQLDLLSIQPLHAPGGNPIRRPPPYRFSASVVLTNVPDQRPGAYAANGAALGNSNPEAIRNSASASSGAPQFTAGERPSLAPLLRFGSDRERFEIRPRRNEIWIQYRRNFD